MQRDQKATVNQTPAILTAYSSHQVSLRLSSFPVTFDLAAVLHFEHVKLAEIVVSGVKGARVIEPYVQPELTASN